MKKLLYIFLFAVLILSGCEKKQELLAPASLFVMDGEATAAGVCPGDGPEECKAAYRDYTLQVAWNDAESNFMVMSPDQIPYDEEISTMIATLFIDAKPVDPEAFCKEQNIQSDEIHDLLSSPDFLRKHDVIYRYLVFEWSDSEIVDIYSEELNYNETFETPRSGT